MGKNATSAAISASASIDVLEAHPDQDQGRDRHHRRHLQDHRIGIKRALDQPALAEQRWPAPTPAISAAKKPPTSPSGSRAATPSASRNCRQAPARWRWARAAHRAESGAPRRSIPRSPAAAMPTRQRDGNIGKHVSCRLQQRLRRRALTFGECDERRSRGDRPVASPARRQRTISAVTRPGRGVITSTRSER